jgi:hypothetical protein
MGVENKFHFVKEAYIPYIAGIKKKIIKIIKCGARKK